MTELLKKLMSTREFAEIYTDSSDTSKFAFGRIVACDELFFIAELVSPSGNYDGLLLKPTDDIIKICVETEYAQKIKIPSANFIKQEYPFNCDDLISEILLYAQEKKLIVAVELLHSGYDDITGFAESADDSRFTVKQVNQYGKHDGTAYANKSDVTQISCDTENEISLLKLYNYNKVRRP